MKQQANLIRAGQVIEHEGQRWTVLKQQIITPGKGGAFIQVEMRNLRTGNKTNERWRTADTKAWGWVAPKSLLIFKPSGTQPMAMTSAPNS